MILVGTHADDESCTDEFLDALYAKLRTEYAEEYLCIKGIYFVSGTRGDGVEALKKCIISTALKEKYLEEEIPKNYMLLEERVRSLAKAITPPLMQWTEFKKLVIEAGISAEDASAAGM